MRKGFIVSYEYRVATGYEGRDVVRTQRDDVIRSLRFGWRDPPQAIVYFTW